MRTLRERTVSGSSYTPAVGKALSAERGRSRCGRNTRQRTVQAEGPAIADSRYPSTKPSRFTHRPEVNKAARFSQPSFVDLGGRREAQMLEQERGSLSQQLWEVLTPAPQRFYCYLEAKARIWLGLSCVCHIR